MGYVDDAFANLKSGLEITQGESDLASRRQKAIRELLDGTFDILTDWLSGSYARHTKTKRLKDVDIFVVLDPAGKQGHLLKAWPGDVLEEFAKVLRTKYDNVSIDRMAAVVQYGDDIASMEVVPAFPRNDGGYFIPDTVTGKWIATDPAKHASLATGKNAECAGRWIPLVKMIKGANRELGDAVYPSFLLEVMALDIVDVPFGRYQDEVLWFFSTAAERIDENWPDPAGLGPDVNAEMGDGERRAAGTALADAAEIAERAVWLEDDGQERAAVEQWRKLFGSRMPRP